MRAYGMRIWVSGNCVKINYLINIAADLAQDDGFEQDAQEMRQMTYRTVFGTRVLHDINLNGRPLSRVRTVCRMTALIRPHNTLHTYETERHETAVGKLINRLQGIGIAHGKLCPQGANLKSY